MVSGSSCNCTTTEIHKKKIKVIKKNKEERGIQVVGKHSWSKKWASLLYSGPLKPRIGSQKNVYMALPTLNCLSKTNKVWSYEVVWWLIFHFYIASGFHIPTWRTSQLSLFRLPHETICVGNHTMSSSSSQEYISSIRNFISKRGNPLEQVAWSMIWLVESSHHLYFLSG